MGHQKKRVPKLEPVLENYMGPPISYNSTASKPSRYGGSTAKVAPASETSKHRESKGLTSLSPANIFGKLRDRYVKVMNEVAMSGDLASVAGTHGCIADPEYYPEHQRASAAREMEIRALREELAARRRQSELVSVDDSDNDDDLGVAEYRASIHRQSKNVTDMALR